MAIMDQRTSNNATVKDLTDMQKYFKVRMEDMHSKCEELNINKGHSQLKIGSQLDIIGKMAENFAQVPDGTFKERSEAKKALIVAEQHKKDERRLEAMRHYEEELRQKQNSMLEDEEVEK